MSAGINQALRQLAGGSASPRDWSQRFTDALTTFGILGKDVVRRRQLSSGEVQTHDRFVELLDEFGGLTSVAGLDVARRRRAMAERAGQPNLISARPAATRS